MTNEDDVPEVPRAMQEVPIDASLLPILQKPNQLKPYSSYGQNKT